MWSLGVLIGGSILALIALVGLAGVILGVWVKATDRDGDGGGWPIIGLGVGVILFAVVWAAAPFIGFYPYKAEYHHWETQQGTVEKVSARFLGDGKSTTQRFVVLFTDGRERACDDTRCSLVQPGDHLTLSCKRHWQYAGEDGWDCNYVRRGGAA